MISKCPSCKKDVDHEDFLFEVLCSCGARFNPFMQAEVPGFDAPPADAGSDAEGMPGVEADYSESRAVFDELRSFGETMTAGQESSDPSIHAPASATPARAPAKPPVKKPLAGTPVGASGFVLTCGDHLPGMKIEAYLSAVSASAALAADAVAPLQNLFAALTEQALASGATALIAVRWSVLPDGTRVLASGTAVTASASDPTP